MALPSRYNADDLTNLVNDPGYNATTAYNSYQSNNAANKAAYNAQQKKKQDSYTGQLPEYEYGPGAFGKDDRFPTATYPTPPSRITDAMNGQLGLANTYENGGAQAGINAQQNIYKQQKRNDLANSIKSTRGSFNSRGLLRSGARQGAEAGLVGQANSDLAANRYGLNQQAIGNQETLENNAVNSGLAYTGNAPGLGASALNGVQNNLENDIANMNATGQLVSSASGLGGKALASSILKSRNS